MNHPAHIAASQPRQWGSLQLIGTFGIIAAVWLLVLPKIAEQPQMEAHLEWLDERGIDPSAMYYTELQAMEPILQRLSQRERTDGD